MSLQMKLIIPLLDKAITKEDVSPEAGFVDAYVHDKNRPGIENCIFLLYDLSVKTKQSGIREYHFSKCTNLYNTKVDFIDGKPYKIFAFKLIGKDLKDIYNGLRPKEQNNVIRVLSFWRGYDDDINNTLLVNKLGKISRDWKEIPEYDYRPEMSIGFGYKKSGTP